MQAKNVTRVRINNLDLISIGKEYRVLVSGRAGTFVLVEKSGLLSIQIVVDKIYGALYLQVSPSPSDPVQIQQAEVQI
jgi:hypothetical protein